MGVKRFSISLPPSLAKELDEISRIMGYTSRSKVIHDAVRSFITEYRWMRGKETGEIMGAIVMIYYLDKPGLVTELMKIQHKFINVISSAMHIHLTEHKCMEVIVVRGGAEEIRNLAQELMTKKGVKELKLTAVSP